MYKEMWTVFFHATKYFTAFLLLTIIRQADNDHC